MVLKTLMKSIRQYKKQSIASPVFVSIEVIMECILPLIMAKVIDSMNGNSMGPILKYGLILVIFAMISLFFGVMAGKQAATASCGFAKAAAANALSWVKSVSSGRVTCISP